MFVALSVIFAMSLMSLSACSKKKAGDSPAVDVETGEDLAPAVEVTEGNAEGDMNEGRDLKMPVLEDVFFDYDSANLAGEARRVLEKNAGQLKDASGSDVAIEGHCDERGTIAYNLALGERRAKVAKDYLVSLGVSGNRLKIISYGKERPFDPGHSESAWAKNRRAHFVAAN
jgi:peptidoglycan-associated lipoprotein